MNPDISSLFEKQGLLAGVELGAAPREVSAHALAVTIDAPHGIVKSVQAGVTEFEERERATALFAALAPRVTTHFGGKIEKQTPRLIIVKVAQPASTVELRHFSESQDGSEIDTVTLSVVLDDDAIGTAAKPALGFDVQAVARSLASKKFPAEAIEPIAVKKFTRHDGDAEWKAVVAAAEKEHSKRKAEIVAEVLRACPWNELQYGANWPAAKILAGLMEATIAYRFQRKPFAAWATLSANDLFATVEMLELPVAERGEAAVQVFRALELGDAPALEWVRSRLKPPGPFLHAIFDATDEIEARLFGLIASTVPDELDQLKLPFRAATSNASRAATTWFAKQRKLKLEPLKVTCKTSDWQLASESLAGWFALVKSHFPQHFDAVVTAFADRRQLYGPDIIAAVCSVVGETVSKTVFRLGATEFKVTSRNVTASPAKPGKTKAKAKK